MGYLLALIVVLVGATWALPFTSLPTLRSNEGASPEVTALEAGCGAGSQATGAAVPTIKYHRGAGTLPLGGDLEQLVVDTYSTDGGVRISRSVRENPEPISTGWLPSVRWTWSTWQARLSRPARIPLIISPNLPVNIAESGHWTSSHLCSKESVGNH